MLPRFSEIIMYHRRLNYNIIIILNVKCKATKNCYNGINELEFNYTFM